MVGSTEPWVRVSWIVLLSVKQYTYLILTARYNSKRVQIEV